MKNRKYIATILLTGLLFVTPAGQSHAEGLDLKNQAEIQLENLDLNEDQELTRDEVSRYMFYYFDHDGNESLTNFEFWKERPLTVLPYDETYFELVDIDNDGEDDGVVYTTETFLQAAMVEYEAPDEEGLSAKDFISKSFLKLDIDNAGSLTFDEWDDEYQQHGVRKPRKRPKSANNNRYN